MADATRDRRRLRCLVWLRGLVLAAVLPLVLGQGDQVSLESWKKWIAMKSHRIFSRKSLLEWCFERLVSKGRVGSIMSFWSYGMKPRMCLHLIAWHDLCCMLCRIAHWFIVWSLRYLISSSMATELGADMDLDSWNTTMCMVGGSKRSKVFGMPEEVFDVVLSFLEWGADSNISSQMAELLEWNLYGWTQSGPRFVIEFLCQTDGQLQKWISLRRSVLHFYDEIDLQACTLQEKCEERYMVLRKWKWSERWGNPSYGYMGVDPYYPENWICWQWNESALDEILSEGQKMGMDDHVILEMEGWYPGEEAMVHMRKQFRYEFYLLESTPMEE